MSTPHREKACNMDSTVSSDLEKLSLYLSNLPATPPLSAQDQVHDFRNFAPDMDWLREIGEEGAVNRQLEIMLGSRDKGGIQLKGQGPGITALAGVLRKYLEKYPGSVILQKWLSDLIESAIRAFTSAGLQVRIVS